MFTRDGLWHAVGAVFSSATTPFSMHIIFANESMVVPVEWRGDGYKGEVTRREFCCWLLEEGEKVNVMGVTARLDDGEDKLQRKGSIQAKLRYQYAWPVSWQLRSGGVSSTRACSFLAKRRLFCDLFVFRAYSYGWVEWLQVPCITCRTVSRCASTQWTRGAQYVNLCDLQCTVGYFPALLSFYFCPVLQLWRMSSSYCTLL